MIKSCKDIKTMDQFREFSKHIIQTGIVGLNETATMLRWSHYCLVRPALFNNIVERDRKVKDD